ncbi:zinc finger CCHC domain-containing protein 17-like [Dreissena polymorpha]|uniref:Nucleolar protein of 40 kDa n=1 Tax=Dreissena polymorpha TaxID=45954 RepID=A0A9D4N021_DREPO|nr:zinc finger CCHC domain-containing protein 17-like [Dreissena polymorpha]KAH3886505.1 hypothetical protein DPMN_010515 [Dreissena polymorpha]
MAHTTSREDRSGTDGPLKRRKSEGPIPQLYKIFHGEVASVKEYGLFVKIPGTTRQGLVHKSQISHSKVDDPSEMFSRGEYVYCKVISLDEDGEKIGLAMKMVNQTTGIDQDPNNVELSLDEKKRRQFGNRPERQKIVLEAVLDTTCKKCGGKGHLAQDCFKTGETSYELIPDLDDYMKTVVTEEGTVSHAKKNKKSSKKSKKEKREKKEKKRKRQHSRSGSSSDSEDSDSHKKSKKKTKKQKKRYSSSSDSG